MGGDNENRFPLSDTLGDNDEEIYLIKGALSHFMLIRDINPHLSCQFVFANADATDVTFPYIKLSDAPFGCLVY